MHYRYYMVKVLGEDEWETTKVKQYLYFGIHLKNVWWVLWKSTFILYEDK